MSFGIFFAVFGVGFASGVLVGSEIVLRERRLRRRATPQLDASVGRGTLRFEDEAGRSVGSVRFDVPAGACRLEVLMQLPEVQ